MADRPFSICACNMNGAEFSLWVIKAVTDGDCIVEIQLQCCCSCSAEQGQLGIEV